MSKNEKQKNNTNPFSEGENEEIKIDDNIEENPLSAEDADNKEQDISKEAVEEEKTSENNETTAPEEKKGIFDGLFKKNDDELKKLKDSYETLNNQYLRLAADFDNYRKRQESERESLIKFGMEQALKKMIEIADNFSRAEKSMVAIEDCEKAKEAFNVLNKQFIDSITKLGLEEIKAEGEIFNPNVHEAVMQVPTDEHPEDTVIQEMQKGYKFGDKVLRPSMVSVAVSK
ncbi:MAG: nucleotide exchange factor GrpE [Candidatus Gastranaerophilaceae bacterium]